MRNPLSAALFSSVVTLMAVYFTKNGKDLPNSAYIKPAFFVGLLVYFIVHVGTGKLETISKEPF
jgi:hypothetical protein